MFEVNVSPYRMGRQDDNELTVRSDCVSSHHAELVFHGNTVLLRDLQSTNGTFVNGNRVVDQLLLESGDRIQLADVELILEGYSVGAVAESKAAATRTIQRGASFEPLWLISRFDQLERSGLYAAFQPIVHAKDQSVYGQESLARSTTEGLERPDLMFEAARQLHREVPFSQLCRKVALEASRDRLRPEQALFMNTHPAEDLLADVLKSLQELRAEAPDQRMVIEIHEAAVTSLSQLVEFTQGLRAIDIELAYDDFGAGQTRLRELIEVPPDYIKFDRGLISGLHTAPEIQHDLLKSLVQTSRKVGATTIAEGIEEPECGELCRELGFDLFQGYLYGRPE